MDFKTLYNLTTNNEINGYYKINNNLNNLKACSGANPNNIYKIVPKTCPNGNTSYYLYNMNLDVLLQQQVFYTMQQAEKYAIANNLNLYNTTNQQLPQQQIAIEPEE